MEPQNNSVWHRVWRIARIPIYVTAALYVVIVIYSIPHYLEKTKTKKIVDRIQAQKLTLRDVMGENLPSEPDPALKDATVAGVDANSNGIRDDVELAIFKLHPESARIRAAELQYAMALQNELVSVFNTDTWREVAKDENNGISCLIDLSFDKYADIKDQINKSKEWEKEVELLVFNADARKLREQDNKKYEAAYAVGKGKCDIDPSTFSS